MEKKLLVMLFPVEDFTITQEEYLQEITNSNIKLSDVFDSIIQKRYLDQGYEFAIATYPDRKTYGVSISPQRVAISDSNYDDFYKRDIATIMDDYKYMAELDPTQYSEVVVGGYHLGDCVDKFVASLKNITPAKVSIDMELTSMFMRYGLLNSDGSLNTNYEFYNQIVSRMAVEKQFDDDGVGLQV